jgi:hypothetical protein
MRCLVFQAMVHAKVDKEPAGNERTNGGIYSVGQSSVMWESDLQVVDGI